LWAVADGRVGRNLLGAHGGGAATFFPGSSSRRFCFSVIDWIAHKGIVYLRAI
jgi:hypothetical protein